MRREAPTNNHPMYPVLFESTALTLYSYGFMIAVGIVAGMGYLVMEGKKSVGLTFDQANMLFLLVFLAAVVGGKLFLFFEAPSRYLHHPGSLMSGRGFVFYGSFLAAIPAMWWFFRKIKLHPYKMLDVMAITTCLVHLSGRIGCFMAGCCYGKPTDSWIGITFSDPSSHAEPLHTPLFPTQLMEAAYILMVMITLLVLKGQRRFYGQLFLTYLMLYAIGRFAIEYLRGDLARGFVVDGYLSHAQLIALGMLAGVALAYYKWSRTRMQTPPR